MTEQPPDDTPDEVGNLKVFPDEPPKSGEWVDVDKAISEVTLEEAEAGRKLGEAIDVDDDEDSGPDHE